mgnify:FL=1
MNCYEINKDTIALIPIDDFNTKVIEKNSRFIVNMNTMKIIERSCEYFGSSYLGRHEGTKSLIGVSHKSPIIIEESRNMIYFPSTSPRLSDCIWFSLNHITDYKDLNGKSIVYFENGESVEIDISIGSFDNQYLRATKLESILRKRKNI